MPDPVIDRITRNVLTRLSGPKAEWERIGHANNITAMTACENLWGAKTTPNGLTCASGCCRFVLVDQAA